MPFNILSYFWYCTDKQTFPTFDFLGWYSTGNQIPTSSDLLVQKQLEEFNENPLYLLLDPTGATPEARELPISVYEPEVKVVEEKLKSYFATVKYQIATGEAERVAVDYIAKVNNSTDDDSMRKKSFFFKISFIQKKNNN